MISVYRALNRLLQQYGPWLTTLAGADRVAIIAERRMVIRRVTLTEASRVPLVAPVRLSERAKVIYDVFAGRQVQPAAAPLYRERFGHTIPNWDFGIVEHPAPGQYRYAQFAWRGAAETKSLALHFTGSANENVDFYAGEKPGSPATSLLLPARDGIILCRQSGQHNSGGQPLIKDE
jgi:hypothetical protein